MLELVALAASGAAAALVYQLYRAHLRNVAIRLLEVTHGPVERAAKAVTYTRFSGPPGVLALTESHLVFHATWIQSGPGRSEIPLSAIRGVRETAHRFVEGGGHRGSLKTREVSLIEVSYADDTASSGVLRVRVAGEQAAWVEAIRRAIPKRDAMTDGLQPPERVETSEEAEAGIPEAWRTGS